jgi:hypothetical protein
MARNDNGGQPNVTYRTFYDRALRNASGDVQQNPGTWRPQVVVVSLGTNDFWTAISLSTMTKPLTGTWPTSIF